MKGLDSRTKAEVMVTKEGYGPRLFAQRPTGAKNWVILMSSQTYFEGIITDPQGKPVADATIRAAFGPIQMDGGMADEILTETRSRADGTYRLHVSSNEYDIQITAAGRGVARHSNMKIWRHMARQLPIKLMKAVHFEARVVDSVTGEPVEGFVLFRWQPPFVTGRSDAKGQIVLDDLAPGPFEMQCGGGELKKMHGLVYYDHGAFGRWWSQEALKEWEKFQIAEENDWQRNFDGLSFHLSVNMPPVKIVVERGVSVSGRVTDPKGNPVEGATVGPARTGSGNSLTGDTRYSVRTDKDGKYSTVLPASNGSKYNLIVHDGDYEEWRNWANGISKVIQTKPGQTIENFDLQLTTPAVVRGRVISNGRPVADRLVRTHDFHKMENRYYDPTVRTKADGTFELKFVRPGKHHLEAADANSLFGDPGDNAEVIDVEAGDVLEEIELEAK